MVAADRVFRIVIALAPPYAGACRTGSVILIAKLIAGHDAEGERRYPARMIRVPPVSSIWIPVRRRAPALRGIQRA
jgi:hypothetical protein